MERVVVLRNGKLVYYYQKPSPEYWSKLWDDVSLTRELNDVKNNPLTNRILNRYIRPYARVLDAGCGLGIWTKLLSERKCYTVGLDFDTKTLVRLKKVWNNLELVAGDVRCLPFRTNSFDIVLSLGVIEHIKEGPQIAIGEFTRLLKRHGLLIISFPWMNILRITKALLKLYRTTPPPYLEFYQYVFYREEVVNILRSRGFVVIEFIPYDILTTLSDEFPWLRGVIRKFLSLRKKEKSRKSDFSIKGRRLGLGTTLLHYILNIAVYALGHMLLIVAVKVLQGHAESCYG